MRATSSGSRLRPMILSCDSPRWIVAGRLGAALAAIEEAEYSERMSEASFDSIRSAFLRDGVKGLKHISDRVSPSDEWIAGLILGIADPDASVPASWMLRAYLQQGAELPKQQTVTLLKSLRRIAADDARLHICQLVTHLDIPTRNAEALARFLRDCFEGTHKFTRAWAADGMHRLSLQHERYRLESLRWIDRASRDEAASVRARARQIARESS
ncbi:MAG: hypothetical protein ACI841_000991 [Planctomycetota bacterium]|jgi:hypothetical protein